MWPPYYGIRSILGTVGLMVGRCSFNLLVTFGSVGDKYRRHNRIRLLEIWTWDCPRDNAVSETSFLANTDKHVLCRVY